MTDPDPLGYSVPALPGMAVGEILTPALVIDLDVFEANVDRLRGYAAAKGVRLRPHAKTHKSADIARIQMERGGAVGICCQKVSEAEALIRAGVTDVLISNEVTDPAKIARLAALPALGASLAVCVDNGEVVAALSGAAIAAGNEIGVLVEIECGGNRCGVSPGDPAAALAQIVADAPGLRFDGIQAYNGQAQHIRDRTARTAACAATAEDVRTTLAALERLGLRATTIGGAGTGSFPDDIAEGVHNELQCGSYIFMDADYGRVAMPPDAPRFEPALFVLASVMSLGSAGRPVVDAGLKALSLDSGLPAVHAPGGVTYEEPSDEHGVLSDPAGTLSLNDRVWLIPGHCDPTVNLHDTFVGVRGGVVECLWPVTARGKVF